ncbi:S24 family peptidase [Paenibacillus abyssi]|uniref:Peptidase S24/S26A/S26B/S26C domain-containing protein n=1 Tax=Paenibacillus abyssi TaxID=1340531 RepID=A0A917FVP0_9BACL|nr:S24 family peptidase [Paenibacillus abyssi]GGG09655.1 hypothetical protein GCM10010916_28170 [Paenibacillus abyssi]
MGYYESLVNMINSSGLTLKEISDKCEDQGVKVAPSYISKLQTKRQAPASDEVNAAIARVCNADIEDFLYESYIEKSPDTVKELHQEIEVWFRGMLKGITEVTYPDEVAPLILDEQNKLSGYRMIRHCLKNFPPTIEDNQRKDHDDVTGYEFVMSDDSMEPLLPNGSTLTVNKNEIAEDGDIIVAVNNDEIIVRKYYLVNGECLLTPIKGKDVLIVQEGELKIMGVVKSVSINI